MSRRFGEISEKVFFMLLLFSSLLVHIKLPYVGYGVYNLLLPSFALILVALNMGQFKDAFWTHRQAFFFMCLLYVWMWVSALFSDFQTIAIKYSVKYSIHFVVLISFSILTYKKRDQFSYYHLALRFLILVAVFGIIEFLFPDLWFFPLLRSPDSLMVYPRISSLMLWPNQFGALMGIGMVLGLILHKYKSISDYEFYLSLFLFIVVNSLAASRNGWLVLLLGILLAWLYRVIRFKRALLIVCLWSFCVLFFPISTNQLGIRDSHVFPLMNLWGGESKTLELPTPLETATQRLLLWTAAKNEISKRPITGIGIQVFDKIIGKQILGREGYHAHNLFLNILVEMGIPGLLLFLIFIYSLLKRADWHSPIVGIPMMMVFAAQILDFYIHDATFATIGFYFLAEAGNSKNEDN